jgi:hypothetical protein
LSAKESSMTTRNTLLKGAVGGLRFEIIYNGGSDGSYSLEYLVAPDDGSSFVSCREGHFALLVEAARAKVS